MDREFFNKQMFRLKEIYNTKYKDNYPIERCNILYAKFKMVSNDDFKRCVSFLIATQKFAPLYKEFSDYLSEALKQSAREILDKEESKMNNCVRCNNTGTVFLDKNIKCPISGEDTTSVFGYRCVRCPRGNLYNSQYIKADPEVYQYE